MQEKWVRVGLSCRKNANFRNGRLEIRGVTRVVIVEGRTEEINDELKDEKIRSSPHRAVHYYDRRNILAR